MFSQIIRLRSHLTKNELWCNLNETKLKNMTIQQKISYSVIYQLLNVVSWWLIKK